MEIKTDERHAARWATRSNRVRKCLQWMCMFWHLFVQCKTLICTLTNFLYTYFVFIIWMICAIMVNTEKETERSRVLMNANGSVLNENKSHYLSRHFDFSSINRNDDGSNFWDYKSNEFKHEIYYDFKSFGNHYISIIDNIMNEIEKKRTRKRKRERMNENNNKTEMLSI